MSRGPEGGEPQNWVPKLKEEAALRTGQCGAQPLPLFCAHSETGGPTVTSTLLLKTSPSRFPSSFSLKLSSGDTGILLFPGP